MVGILVFVASVLCAATAYGLRQGVLAGPRIVLSGFDGIGVVVGFMVFTLASALLGPTFGISLIVSFLLHEFGHVIAYRMVGHQDARFRLVPVLSGVQISDQPLKTDGQAFFVALMGPGISIAPMALAYSLSVALSQHDPQAASLFRVFAVTCGTMNFITLLPFWPLDGGKCARLFAINFWPALAPALTAFLTAALASAAWRTGSIALLVLALVGLQSMFRKKSGQRIAMSPDVGLTAMAAYAFTMAAHFSGGWMLLSLYL